MLIFCQRPTCQITQIWKNSRFKSIYCTSETRGCLILCQFPPSFIKPNVAVFFVAHYLANSHSRFSACEIPCRQISAFGRLDKCPLPRHPFLNGQFRRLQITGLEGKNWNNFPTCDETCILGLVQKMRDICQLDVSEFSIAQFCKEGEEDKHCIVGGLLLKKKWRLHPES